MYNNSLNKSLLKKKLKEVSVDIKINALKKLEGGTSVYDIAKELDVSHTTVRHWKKKKDILIHQNTGIKKPAKRVRKQRYNKVNKAVWIWFKTARASGVPISGSMIQAKALNFSAQFNEDNTFTASNGWLRSWKNYYRISSTKICNETLSPDSEAVDPFKETFLNYIEREGLTDHQVFNADETRLYYKLLPKTTSCEDTNDSPEGCKEALTVMACSNASGTCKLPLVVVGKYGNPQRFKQEGSPPVVYMNQNKAWMTGGLFITWFEDEFVPHVKEYLKNANLPCKALLVIDNCASYNLTLSIDDITVSFFPPNTTSLIQPMDEGSLQVLKLLYKKCLMNYIVECIDQKMSMMDITESISVTKAIVWAGDAWHEISANTIQKSWNRIWPWAERINICQDYLVQQQEILNSFEIFCNYLRKQDASTTLNVSDLQKWLCSIHTDVESDLTAKDIVEIVQDDEQHDTNDNNEIKRNDWNCDDEDNNDSVSAITEAHAKLCIKFLREFCEENNFSRSIAAIDIIEKETQVKSLKNTDMN